MSGALTPAWLGLEWQRPFGLLALLLPLGVVWLHRVRSRPRELATATLSIWRAVAEERSARQARARRSLPPRLWCLVAALVVAAVALGGPRASAGRAPRSWLLVVDRSPSMYLPWSAPDGDASAESRLARALEEFEVGWRGVDRGDDRLIWMALGARGWEQLEGQRIPAAWTRAPLLAVPEPDWRRFDQRGSLWLTDRVPEPRPERAGLCTSGGGAVPGLIGRDREGGLEWDGEALVRSRVELAAPTFTLGDAAGVARQIGELVEIWARDRGLVEGTDGADLAMLGSDGGATFSLRAGRDGWSLRGLAAEAGVPREDQHGVLEVWLEDPSGLPLVSFGRGRVHVALAEIEHLGGDPAAFALSWARLLDDARRPPPGAVSLRQRLAAGEARFEAGEPAVSAAGGATISWDAWLVLLALGLAGLALAVR